MSQLHNGKVSVVEYLVSIAKSLVVEKFNEFDEWLSIC